MFPKLQSPKSRQVFLEKVPSMKIVKNAPIENELALQPGTSVYLVISMRVTSPGSDLFWAVKSIVAVWPCNSVQGSMSP